MALLWYYQLLVKVIYKVIDRLKKISIKNELLATTIRDYRIEITLDSSSGFTLFYGNFFV